MSGILCGYCHATLSADPLRQRMHRITHHDGEAADRASHALICTRAGRCICDLDQTLRALKVVDAERLILSDVGHRIAITFQHLETIHGPDLAIQCDLCPFIGRAWPFYEHNRDAHDLAAAPTVIDLSDDPMRPKLVNLAGGDA